MTDPGRQRPIRIACFGDSITEGIGACPMETMCYPPQLQRLLGDGFTVLNFGSSGMTLQREGDYPYCKDRRYEACFRSDPDLVIVMIGTNDSKKQNADADRYERELGEAVERFLSLPSSPDVILASCCTAFSDIDTISNAFISGPMREAQKKVSARYGIPFVDICKETENHPDWFCDRIHPSNEGYGELAAIFREAVLRVLDGKKTCKEIRT